MAELLFCETRREGAFGPLPPCPCGDRVRWHLPVGGLRPPPASRCGILHTKCIKQNSDPPSPLGGGGGVRLSCGDLMVKTCPGTPQAPSYLSWFLSYFMTSAPFNKDVKNRTITPPRIGSKLLEASLSVQKRSLGSP